MQKPQKRRPHEPNIAANEPMIAKNSSSEMNVEPKVLNEYFMMI